MTKVRYRAARAAKNATKYSFDCDTVIQTRIAFTSLTQVIATPPDKVLSFKGLQGSTVKIHFLIIIECFSYVTSNAKNMISFAITEI